MEQLQPASSIVERQYIGSGGIHSTNRLEIIDELVVDGRNFRKELADYVDAPANGVVIDVGSSTGKVSDYIRDKFSGTVVGTDIDPLSLTMARNSQDSRIRPAAFVVGDMVSLPFRSGSADTLVNSLTFHHAEDEEKLSQAMSESHRVIKEDGQLLSLVNGEEQKGLHSEILNETFELFDIEPFKRFANTLSKETAPNVLSAAGFVIRQTIPQQTIMRFHGEEGFNYLKRSLITYFIGYEELLSEYDLKRMINRWKEKYTDLLGDNDYVDDNIDRVIIDARKMPA